MTTSCPLCQSKKYDSLYPSYQGTCVSSDFKMVTDACIDNKICHDCGLIFNAQGIRTFSKRYYSSDYKLLLKDNEGEIKNFSQTGSISQALLSYTLFKEMCHFDPALPLLETGAGNGEFLWHLRAEHAECPVEAFEPSESFKILSERIPGALIVQSDYADFSASKGVYGTVISLGVLEHVENPLHMMNWIWEVLVPGGTCFLRIPLFDNNPNDLLTVDHLSKLTLPTLHYLASATGFEIVEDRQKGVPVFLSLRKVSKPAQLPDSVYDANIAIARQNEKFLRGAFGCILETRKAAERDNSPWAIFGLAMSGLFAPYFLSFEPSEISAYIDENSSMWNSTVNERPVYGLDMIEEHGIRHVAVVVSPVYHEQIVKKLATHEVTVHVP